MTLAQADRARQIAEVTQAWQSLSSQHRMEFQPVSQPEPPAPEPLPMFSVLLSTAEREELRGVSRFDREGRREARSRARSGAEAEAMQVLSVATQEHASRQEVVAAQWAALTSGEPRAVVTAVTRAFADRGVPVAVSVDDSGDLRLLVQVPGPEAVPTHQPAVTPAGAPTLKKLTKTETAHHVREVAAARVLLAAKEAVAHSPSSSTVLVAAHFARGPVVLRSRLSRAALETAPWSRTAWEVLQAVDPEIDVNIGGRTQELRPLDV